MTALDRGLVHARMGAPDSGEAEAATHDCEQHARDVRCTHCGLPVPRGLIKHEGVGEQFCCHGCETAHSVITSCGLDRYYDLVGDDDGAQSKATGRGYEEFDDPAFQDRYAPVAGASSVRSGAFIVEGMHCAACVWLIEKVPSAVQGLIDARVDYARGRVHLTWDSGHVNLSRIASFIDRLGYPMHAARASAAEDARRDEQRAMLIRIGVAGALAGNVMAIFFGIHGGSDGQMGTFFRWVTAVLGTVSVAWPGRVFLRGALASLRMRTVHMDVPIAVALLVGLSHGLFNTVTGHGDVYFDTIATLVFLLLLGRWVQVRQQRVAADSVELLHALTPSVATLLDQDGSTRLIEVSSLAIDDVVRVSPGESVPADGVITRGSTSVDLSLLTGESRPESVCEGGMVVAGSVNLESTVDVRVQAAGEETRVGKLMRMVEDAATRRAPIVRAADKLSGFFAVTVLILAVLTVCVWWGFGWSSLDVAIEHAVSLLIVTCPCALGLATPLAVVVAVGRAARTGILIKGGDTLEALGQRGTIVLDKTGTLTEGKPRVLWADVPDDVLRLVSLAEQGIVHPIARALVDAGGIQRSDQDKASLVSSVAHTVGGGLRADTAEGELVVGSASYVESVIGSVVFQSLQRSVDRATAEGGTPVCVAIHSEGIGVIAVGDTLREESSGVISRLRRDGWEPMVLSGDHPVVVDRIARELGLDPSRGVGGVSPEEKLRVIEELAQTGRVIMVGDGVNDAAALAAATVGIAVHGGAEASLEAADVYLSEPGLNGLARLVEGARRALGVIRRNLFVSLCYNVVFAGLAIAGLVNPLAAAVLMPLSGITVVVLSYRSRTFDVVNS